MNHRQAERHVFRLQRPIMIDNQEIIISPPPLVRQTAMPVPKYTSRHARLQQHTLETPGKRRRCH